MTGQILGSLLVSVLGVSACVWAFVLTASLISWTRNIWRRKPGVNVKAVIVTIIIGDLLISTLATAGAFMIHWGFNAWPVVWGVK